MKLTIYTALNFALKIIVLGGVFWALHLVSKPISFVVIAAYGLHFVMQGLINRERDLELEKIISKFEENIIHRAVGGGNA